MMQMCVHDSACCEMFSLTLLINARNRKKAIFEIQIGLISVIIVGPSTSALTILRATLPIMTCALIQTIYLQATVDLKVM